MCLKCTMGFGTCSCLGCVFGTYGKAKNIVGKKGSFPVQNLTVEPILPEFMLRRGSLACNLQYIDARQKRKTVILFPCL